MQRKLDVQRLDSAPLPVTGYYEVSAAVGAAPKCFLLGESFEENPGFHNRGIVLRGELKNFNTKEEFRDFLGSGARALRVAEAANELRDAIVSGEALKDPTLLRPMVIVAFADLKRYHFAYTVGFPVLAPLKAWAASGAPRPAADAGVGRDTLCQISRSLREGALPARAGAFVLHRPKSEAAWELRALADLKDFASAADQDLIVGFVDSSADDGFGWPLRNILLALAHHMPGARRILAFRDAHLDTRGAEVQPRSRVVTVEVSADAAAAVLTATVPAEAQFAGWSKIQNFDLTAFLDKKRIAADAVDLNVKLMKWRLLPELEPEKMQRLSFLLLGAGTLGCSVARTLMGWGVRRMTFVDSGRVSLSNPVRQSLFTHRDAAESRPKAQAAAEAVKAVMPDAEVEHVELEIPMPGHPHQSAASLHKAVRQLQALIASHDVVCMLTDSRESRWLPSLLVAAAQSGPIEGRSEEDADRPPPLGLTVALGFDSFLVSRQTYMDAPSACYFCNDMSAPADSIAFRTLDQQCTVTRPGLAGLASNAAVELVAALAQHRDGFRASWGTGSAAAVPSPLGQVPHQLRGYLADFRLAPAETEPFAKCICCSNAVRARYEADGMAFIERIIENSAELEDISGLQDMKAGVREDEVVNFDEFDDDM